MKENKLSKEYEDGVDLFLEFAVDNDIDLNFHVHVLSMVIFEK